MGYPMAGHLSKAGYSVRVYNRSKDKASKWVEEYGGAQADTPAEVASGADVFLPALVMTMTSVR